MKVLYSLLGALLFASVCNANNRLDSLVTAGNRAYLYSDRATILSCAQELEAQIPLSQLSREDSLSYTASMLKLFGNYHYENGNYEPKSYPAAEDFYNKAEALNAQRLSTGHLLFQEKAQLHYRLKNYPSALSEIEKAVDYLERSAIFEPGDDEWNDLAMQHAMCLARTGRYDEAVALADATVADYSAHDTPNYARALRMRAKILALSACRPEEALESYREYFLMQKKYVGETLSGMDGKSREQYWLAIRPFIADCYLTEDADAGFLYDVTLFSKALLLQLATVDGTAAPSKEALESLNKTWRDVQKKLDKRSAAIEFISYGDPDDERMAALILKSSGKPIFIRLTSPSQISEITKTDLESTSRRGKDALYTNHELDRAIWTPELLEALKDVNRIYFAPDGYMHRLAIEYLPSVSEHELYRLTSTRRLLYPAREISPSDPTLLVGGIDYNSPCEDISGNNDRMAFENYKGVRFSRLSKDTDESRRISDLRENPKDSVLNGKAASEGAFRTLAPKYKSILVSTHGDFKVKPTKANDIKPAMTDDAMSQSIVAFAGANPSLSKAAKAEVYDGIISAREIAAMDLSNCDIFILSACQSGLGKISPDGVFGLQRGISTAGAGAMILSLWNVNSEATALLMEQLYANLNSGIDLKSAFGKARRFLMEMDRSEPEIRTRFNPATMAEEQYIEQKNNYNTPQYTDAFILIDAI